MGTILCSSYVFWLTFTKIVTGHPTLSVQPWVSFPFSYPKSSELKYFSNGFQFWIDLVNIYFSFLCLLKCSTHTSHFYMQTSTSSNICQIICLVFCHQLIDWRVIKRYMMASTLNDPIHTEVGATHWLHSTCIIIWVCSLDCYTITASSNDEARIQLRNASQNVNLKEYIDFLFICLPPKPLFMIRLSHVQFLFNIQAI